MVWSCLLTLCFTLTIIRDKTLALKYWRQAASNNHVLAQCSLGVLYESRNDHVEALYWFEKAAYQGYEHVAIMIQWE